MFSLEIWHVDVKKCHLALDDSRLLRNDSAVKEDTPKANEEYYIGIKYKLAERVRQIND